MKTILMVGLALFIAPATTKAGGPNYGPRPMTEAAQSIMPRMELIACDNGIIPSVKLGDVSYVRLGTRGTDMPWMPEGQQKSTGHVIALSIPLETTYRTGRTDLPILLVTGETLEAAYAAIGSEAVLGAHSAPGTLQQPKKSPCTGGAVRTFQVESGTVQIFTEADFNFAVVYDPATGKRIYELRRVMGG